MTRSEDGVREHLLGALTTADALDAFLNLPSLEQERFSRWIAIAADDAAYWRRIDILVLAMRMVAPPLRPGARAIPPSAGSAAGA